MRYDYDMFSVIPDDVQSQFQGMLNDIGMSAMASQQTALWRDPRIVEALQGADPVVKDLFIDAGFGINGYDSGAPFGRFFERDRVAREQRENDFLDALAEALDDGSLDGANWNGFELEAFLEYLETAEPIDEIEAAELQAMELAAAKAKSQKKLLAMAALGLGVLAIGFAVIAMLFSPVTVAAL